MDLLDEIFEHGLGHFEIGDHPVAHGTDGHDIARGAAEHLLGLGAHGQHAVLGPVQTNRHHRGLAQDDPLSLDINQGVGRAQVDGQIA